MSICSASLGRNGLPAGLIGHSVSPRPPFQAIRELSHTWVFWSGLPWCQLVHPYIKCYSKLFEKTKTVLSSSFRKEDASLTEDRMASRQCSKDKSIGVLTQSKAPHCTGVSTRADLCSSRVSETCVHLESLHFKSGADYLERVMKQEYGGECIAMFGGEEEKPVWWTIGKASSSFRASCGEEQSSIVAFG